MRKIPAYAELGINTYPEQTPFRTVIETLRYLC